jgi:hypothetical protein
MKITHLKALIKVFGNGCLVFLIEFILCYK